MRLVFVSHSFSLPAAPLANIGGMQRVAMELDSALRFYGTHPLTYDAILLRANWKWVHLLVAPFLLRTYFDLAGRIKRREVDVILFSSMVTASLAVLLQSAARARGIRLVSIVHGQDVTKPVAIYRAFVPRVFEALDLVLPVSGATADACTSRGLSPEKVHVLHNGVVLDRFSAYPSPAGARSGQAFRSGLPSDALLLCSVGRQVRRKGFAWFIEHVMPRLPEHVHYWIGGDGPEGEAIRRAIQSKGLSHRVRLLGRMDDSELTRFYQSADLFIMPNIAIPGDMEGFGIVMLEAAMNGLPSVAARLEGILEVISVGKNGYFVESKDVDGFARRILSLDSNRSALKQLSGTCIAHVARTFGWETVANNYLSALKSPLLFSSH